MSCIHCVQAMHIFFAKFARAAHTIYRGVSTVHGAGATDDEKVPTTCQKQPQSVATDVWKYFTKIFPNKICLKKGWELCQIILVWYQSTLFTLFYIFFSFFRSRKRRGSETLSEEEERSSGDETIRHNQRRGRRSGQRIRKEGRRRGEEVENLPSFPKMSLNQRTGSPIMTECTAAMVLMDLSGSPAGRVSHASGQSGIQCEDSI